MYMNNRDKKLLILGNGFDLQAGLKSSFESFFKTSEKDMITKWLNDGVASNSKDISLISLLLYNTFFRTHLVEQTGIFELPKIIEFKDIFQHKFHLNNDPKKWMDIELFVLNIFTDDVLVKLKHCFDITFKKSEDIEEDEHDCFCDYDKIGLLIKQSIANKQYPTTLSFCDFLMSELNLFEKRFSNYLSKEIEGNLDYAKNTKRIIDSFSDLKGGNLTILNFNYTTIDDVAFGDNNIVQINVHGTLKINPIIGIDMNSLNTEKEEAILFTKTFRKLLSNDTVRVLNNNYSEIIIYGHSLNEQDYSYFQSIFDYVNLYQSSTKLTFIFSDNFVVNKKEYRINITKSIFHLLEKYGQTLNNINHGKNLTHKLILEGRLKLRLMNFID